MAKKKKDEAPEEQAAPETTAEETVAETPVAEVADPVKEEHDKYLRLMAEYDNFRKRSAKERENIYADVRVDTVTKFLPVYDNLQRALAAETADEAYKKGVEMTFTQLRAIFTKLGVEEIEAVGQSFDPTVHNAVMHIDDEAYGENEVAQVFQAGFMLGDKVIRYAIVQVAN